MSDAIAFVDVLAWLYLRKPLHAARVIGILDPGPAGLPGRVFDNAISLLRYDITDIAADLTSSDLSVAAKAEKARDTLIAHRDGLLFQHISWVAAKLQFPAALACPPHVRKADKGFDGLLIEIDRSANNLSRLVLCEDKATSNPRPLVTGKIWPEISLIMQGEKDLEILDAVTALLERMNDVDQEAVLIAASWDRVRQFRVALTAGHDQERDGGYHHLFNGYDDYAIGPLQTRLGNVMALDNVRAFLNELAEKVIAKLEEMRAAGV